MCNHKDYADFVKTPHFSWEKALEPDGPLNPKMIEQIKAPVWGGPSELATGDGGGMGRRRRRLVSSKLNRFLHWHLKELRR